MGGLFFFLKITKSLNFLLTNKPNRIIMYLHGTHRVQIKEVQDMFEEYRGYLIAKDSFGYYEVWNKSGNWLKLKIEGKQKAIDFIDHIISSQED